MNTVLYLIARGFVAAIQVLPLRLVARIGRAFGALAFLLARRHRRIALENLTMVFGKEKTAEEIHAIARENFRRIGENYLSAVKTAAMSAEEIKPHLEFAGLEHFSPPPARNVMAIGHFGNFELYARLGSALSGSQIATTYRALKQPGLNRVMQQLREKSGCWFFERRTEGRALREVMPHPGLVLGLLADQSSAGMFGPFLGRDCHTGLAPAVFALRYKCPLVPGICWRTGLARWRIEFESPIATRENGRARSSEDIMRDANRALEAAVRRDPANWFWVHRRWKD
jgi:KDO2-lipid IV(A) lauroyltransferase